MKNLRQEKAVLLQDRFAMKTVSYLSASTADLSHDVSERLRSARVQAISQRKIVKLRTAEHAVIAGSSAAIGWGSGDGWSWWSRLGSVLPLVALVAGLLAINSFQSDSRTEELAEVDSALLTDELPPAAFSDPGFNQFLKATRQNSASQ